MDSLEKLQVLLPHWIEHNQGHAEECRKWAEKLEKEAGAEGVHSHLNAALAAMRIVTKQLEKSLNAAGGPKTEHCHHH